MDSKVKDYSKVPFTPFASRDGVELGENNCEEVKAGDYISGLLSLESVFCSPSGISMPLKIVSLKAKSLELPESDNKKFNNSDSDSDY